MKDRTVIVDSEGVHKGLYEKLQPLTSSMQSQPKYMNLDVLDRCVELSVRMSGWDDASSWRPYLKKYWFEAAVESAIAKAYFAPDLNLQRSRFDNLSPDKSICMSRLGLKGQFGNQLFQYAWIRLYADVHGLIPVTPYWIGRTLFGLNDPIYSNGEPLRRVNDFEIDMESDIANVTNYSECDLDGYFQMKTSYWKPYQEKWRNLFVHTSKFQKLMDEVTHQLRMGGDRLVVMHYRKGFDYSGSPYHTADPEMYRNWLTKNREYLHNANLYIATNSPDFANAFAEFKPIQAKDLNIELPVLSFLPDWWACRQADVLAIPNSTFSLTAAMLNRNASQFFRIDPDKNELVSFDPWDTGVLLMTGGRDEWEIKKDIYLKKQARRSSIRYRLMSRLRSIWPKFQNQ